MPFNKGKTIFEQKSMDYVTFEKGKQPLVIIPRFGDVASVTVKGKAQLFFSRIVYLLNVIKIYVFLESELRQGYTTWDMAQM